MNDQRKLKILKMAAAAEVGLMVIEAILGPAVRSLLPLGGQHIVQLGIILGGAYCVIELFGPDA